MTRQIQAALETSLCHLGDRAEIYCVAWVTHCPYRGLSFTS